MRSSSTLPSENPGLLRAALNLSNSGIMLFDCLRTATGAIQGFRLVLANRRAEEIAGMSEQQMLNRNGTDLFPNVSEFIWQQAQQVVEQDSTYTTQIKYQTTTQPKESWFELILQKHGDGFAASFTDITALKEQSMLVESVLNGSINGMIAYEAMRNGSGDIYNLRIRMANEPAARIIGIPVEQMTGDTLANQHPAAYTTGLFDRYVHTINTGEPQRFVSHYTYSGLNGWFDISINKLGDGMLMTFVDITETKRYEQELQKLIDNLQRSNQSLERFAYVASHDLQEPLRKIHSFGEILLNESETVSAHGKELIERMQSATDRMNTLIQDLLAYSRLSSQKQPFRRINLQTLVNDVLGDLETAIREKQAVVDIGFLPIVTCDHIQLRQVFQNLLSNALKFVKPNQTPHIRVDCVQVSGQQIKVLPGQTVAETDLAKSFYAISVVDDGIGIDPKYLDRIFTIFQRLHNRSEYKGTGIGLAIVQKVVENHKGYINVESQPDHGATFTIYLPEEPSPIEINGLEKAVA